MEIFHSPINLALLTVKLDDNWGEVSLGAGYNVTDSVHAFIDIVTSFDGDIDQKWRVNFGGRYVF
ncbi:autotransporter outer membrane beta-barrel domain-containing protein [Sutterella sp. AM11-39]|nr:autotransporter outer membrane beta-barrel domain-containing protein [Sutterella sp. AM11-39]